MSRCLTLLKIDNNILERGIIIFRLAEVESNVQKVLFWQEHMQMDTIIHFWHEVRLIK